MHVEDHRVGYRQIKITPALVRCLRSSVARALHRHRKGVGSIPAGGPIVDEFFSTVPGLNLDMCIIFHSK